MGKIKSAWEIALEKTENMEINEEKIRHNSRLDKIRRLVGSYLLSDKDDFDEIKKSLEDYTLQEKREAIEQPILNSLVLPSDENNSDVRKTRIMALIDLIYPENGEIKDLYSQIVDHIKQYPKHREELIERLKAQFEPILREKEAELSQKYGETVHLTVETDKESSETLKNYLERLRNQYQKTLSNAKEQLKEMLESIK